MQATEDSLFSILDRTLARETSGDHCLHEREDILGPVMNLLGQQFLAFFRTSSGRGLFAANFT